MHRSRSRAEWTTFAVASLILLVVTGIVGAEALRHQDPPDPVAELTGPPRAAGERFHVPVAVENEGDRTAEAVQVVASLELGGETIEADQIVDFLAGGDRQELVFVFDDDPADGTLTVRVAGFAVP